MKEEFARKAREVTELACELAFESHRRKGALQKKSNPLSRLGAASASTAFPGALTFDPLAFNPGEQPRQRSLQERHVLREQKESERQHPESKHRQEAENTAGDQQNGERNSGLARRSLT